MALNCAIPVREGRQDDSGRFLESEDDQGSRMFFSVSSLTRISRPRVEAGKFQLLKPLNKMCLHLTILRPLFLSENMAKGRAPSGTI
jgi:hypothetical protein